MYALYVLDNGCKRYQKHYKHCICQEICHVLNGPTGKGCPKKGHFNAENAFYALGYVTLLLKFRYVYYYNSYSQKKSDILKGQKCSVDSAKSETHALYA